MVIESFGSPWTLRVGPHTLVAGSSGSGKASMIWSLLIGLAPAIREGRIEVYGIDLKGGMELTMGRGLLTQYATEPEAAVIFLERAVVRMQARAAELAGNVREHTATVESPHILIVIDELAALTAYQTDRALLRRANNALALLCSQGRAPGLTAFACLQDPRKETLPVRGLSTQTIGLLLRDAMETATVLGEGMREKGAPCHQIPSTLPGRPLSRRTTAKIPSGSVPAMPPTRSFGTPRRDTRLRGTRLFSRRFPRPSIQNPRHRDLAGRVAAARQEKQSEPQDSYPMVHRTPASRNM